jgi:hypothetical protein
MAIRDVHRRTALLAAAGALAASAVGCGGGSASSGNGASASYLAAVTRAADVTDQVPGYKFDMTIATKLADKSFTIDADGSISARGTQGSLNVDVAGKTISELIDKPYFYVKVPGAAKAAAAKGKPWVRANINTLTEAFGGGEALGGGSTDPTQTLSFLKSAGTVARVGREDVRGVPTTRYHAVIDLQRYGAAVPAGQRAAARKYAETFKRISGSSSLPMDVWIDDSSHVLRMAFTLSLCSPEGGRLSESLNMELHDYGPQAVVAPPPESQVTDIDARLKAQFAKGLQQLSCH